MDGNRLADSSQNKERGVCVHQAVDRLRFQSVGTNIARGNVLISLFCLGRHFDVKLSHFQKAVTHMKRVTTSSSMRGNQSAQNHHCLQMHMAIPEVHFSYVALLVFPSDK